MFTYWMTQRELFCYIVGTLHKDYFLSKDDDIEIAALGKMVHTNGLTDLYL